MASTSVGKADTMLEGDWTVTVAEPSYGPWETFTFTNERGFRHVMRVDLRGGTAVRILELLTHYDEWRKDEDR